MSSGANLYSSFFTTSNGKDRKVWCSAATDGGPTSGFQYVHTTTTPGAIGLLFAHSFLSLTFFLFSLEVPAVYIALLSHSANLPSSATLPSSDNPFLHLELELKLLWRREELLCAQWKCLTNNELHRGYAYCTVWRIYLQVKALGLVHSSSQR